MDMQHILVPDLRTRTNIAGRLCCGTETVLPHARCFHLLMVLPMVLGSYGFCCPLTFGQPTSLPAASSQPAVGEKTFVDDSIYIYKDANGREYRRVGNAYFPVPLPATTQATSTQPAALDAVTRDTLKAYLEYDRRERVKFIAASEKAIQDRRKAIYQEKGTSAEKRLAAYQSDTQLATLEKSIADAKSGQRTFPPMLNLGQEKVGQIGSLNMCGIQYADKVGQAIEKPVEYKASDGVTVTGFTWHVWNENPNYELQTEITNSRTVYIDGKPHVIDDRKTVAAFPDGQGPWRLRNSYSFEIVGPIGPVGTRLSDMRGRDVQTVELQSVFQVVEVMTYMASDFDEKGRVMRHPSQYRARLKLVDIATLKAQLPAEPQPEGVLKIEMAPRTSAPVAPGDRPLH